MPKLQDTRKVVKVKLQAIEGGEVEVYDGLLARDAEDLSNIQGQKKICFVLSRLIKSWNLEADDGTVLPVTEENAGLLNVKDVNVIFEGIGITKDFLG